VSHSWQLDFVGAIKKSYPEFFTNAKVLEVGSLDINGSIRLFFENCDYLGVDLGEGRGVDMVAKGEELDFPDGAFDTTASCECFEHNEKWAKTFQNMVRMTRPGGLVFFTCATTGRPEHGTRRTTPQDAPFCGDYYRNLVAEDFYSLSNFTNTYGARVCPCASRARSFCDPEAYGSSSDIAGCGPEPSGRCGFSSCRYLSRFR
jgi:SAM-dependent methyltransferase